MEKVFPNAGEDLVDFLFRCKLEDTEVMLCPRCSAVFDKKAAKGLQELKVQVPNPKSKSLVDRRPNFSFDKPQFGDHDKKYRRQRNYWGGKSYIPPAAVPPNKWITTNAQAKPNQKKWKVIEVGQGSAYHDNSQVSKNYSYTSKNYMGKNLMTRTQWRRYQRKKKAEAQASTSSSNANFPPLTRAHVGKRLTFPPLAKAQAEKKPMSERLFPPLPPIIEGNEKITEPNEDENMLTDNFDSGSEEDLNIICNVVSIMPAEFDRLSEITEDEYDSATKESKDHKPICYYVMNEGEVIESD